MKAFILDFDDLLMDEDEATHDSIFMVKIRASIKHAEPS